MEIVVSVKATPVQDVYPGPAGPGKRFIFSDDLVLERIDNKTPGSGLPPLEQDRRAGTHSGVVTTLRIAAANDAYLPGGGELFQYEATYRLNAVPANPPHALRAGQVTARGVVLVQNGQNVGLRTFAITGGTDAYANARGQVTQPDPPAPGQPDETHLRKLQILL
jgi:hypothetical protein